MGEPTSSRASFVDLIGVGEVLVQLGPSEALPLADAERLDLHVGGAEANVAMTLSRLGYRTALLSRVGDDPLGHQVLRRMAAAGVATHGIERDARHATGLYVKDPTAEGSTSYYYRCNSAASFLRAGHVTDVDAKARIVHLTGVTPALSPSCGRLAAALLERDQPRRALRSFDVNHRPKLWKSRSAAAHLLNLALGADLVFVGRDEAQALWNVRSPEEVRTLLADVPAVVVKDADRGATCFRGERVTTVAALRVEVVEPIGAGDAFAAGFLAAILAEHDDEVALRWGHVLAAQVLLSAQDQPAVAPAEVLQRVAQLSSHQWERGRSFDESFLHATLR